jgi:hypothetical protein
VIQQPQKQSKTKPVYFSGSQFFVKANFREAKFEGEEDFSSAKFSGHLIFRREFKDKASFNYVLFEGKEKVIFDRKFL